MNFPTMAGFNARTFTEAGDKELVARHAPGLQRLGHRRVVPAATRAASSRWASSRCGTSTSPSRRCTASRQEGLPFDQLPRDPARAGLPELPVGPLGPDAPGAVATRTWSSRCTSAPASRSSTGPRRRRSTTSWCSPARSARITAQDLLFGPTLRQFPDLKVALSEGGIGWIPFYFDRIDRHFQNQELAARRRRLRRQDAVRGVPRAHPRLLHHRPVGPAAAATASASTSSPGSATTPTPTRRGRSRPSSPGRSSRTPGCTDDEIHKITWENACRFFDWDPFAAHAEGGGDGRRAAGPGHRRRHHPHVPRRVAEAERGRRHRHPLTPGRAAASGVTACRRVSSSAAASP